MEGSAYRELAGDLERIFGSRLKSLVTYGEPTDEGVHTLCFVEELTFADLAKCASRTGSWQRLGLATPLILTPHEFRRTLDVFPLEYAEIVGRHTVITGSDPFAGVAVKESDLRRGCEYQAKSQLIHLREGFLETGGDSAAIARLVAASSTTLRTLLKNLDRLDPSVAARAGITADLMREVGAAADTAIADPSALFARYVAAVERLWQDVDGWR